MLKILGQGGLEDFTAFAKRRPDQVRHLTAYGLISGNPWKVKLPFLIKFLEADLPLDIGEATIERDDDKNWATISELRNRLEPKIRRLIKRTFQVKYGVERWIDPILKVVPSKERDKLNGVDRDEILQRRLYLPNLLEAISQNWGDFSFLSSGLPESALQKDQFEILLRFINTHREDAHAKALSAPEMATLKVAALALETALDRFLVD
jgi:hypothetical protein